MQAQLPCHQLIDSKISREVLKSMADGLKSFVTRTRGLSWVQLYDPEDLGLGRVKNDGFFGTIVFIIFHLNILVTCRAQQMKHQTHWPAELPCGDIFFD